MPFDLKFQMLLFIYIYTHTHTHTHREYASWSKMWFFQATYTFPSIEVLHKLWTEYVVAWISGKKLGMLCFILHTWHPLCDVSHSSKQSVSYYIVQYWQWLWYSTFFYQRHLMIHLHNWHPLCDVLILLNKALLVPFYRNNIHHVTYWSTKEGISCFIVQNWHWQCDIQHS